MKKPKKAGNFYAGTSGLVLPIPKYKFPAEHHASSRLTYYSSLFTSLEVNSTFYKLPLAGTISKWSGEVSASFNFTFKLWKEITHSKGLVFKQTDLRRFLEVINSVGEKKGCLLLQFPPGLSVKGMTQLKKLLQAIRKIDPAGAWVCALEFRHVSWYVEDVFKLAKTYGAIIVIHDKKGSATPAIQSSAKVVYLRFHGPGGDYRGSYTDDFLAEYAGYVKEWMKEGKTVYAYFNNTLGDAIPNLNTLMKYVKR